MVGASGLPLPGLLPCPPRCLLPLLVASATWRTAAALEKGGQPSSDAGLLGGACGDGSCSALGAGMTGTRRLATATFRIGLSYSVTVGEAQEQWAGPPDPYTVQRSLEMLIKTVNDMHLKTSWGDSIRLEELESPYGYDDQSNSTMVSTIYEWYNTSDVDLLLCPSRSEFHHVAAQALEGSDKVLICYSAELWRYYDFPIGQLVPSHVISQTAKLYKEALAINYTAAVMEGNVTLDDPRQPTHTRQRMAIRVREHIVKGDMDAWRDVAPNGRLWLADGLQNKFDINVLFSERWDHALYRGRKLGSSTLFIIEGFHASAVGKLIAETAAGMGYKNITLARLGLDKLFDLRMYVMHIQGHLPDVVLPLISLEDTQTLVGMLRLTNTVPKLFLLNVFKSVITSMSEGFVINQMHFPMLWSPPIAAPHLDPIFGDYGAFQANYMHEYYTDDEFEFLMPHIAIPDSADQQAWMDYFQGAHKRAPPLAALQLASAGSAWVQALTRATSRDPDDVAAELRHPDGFSTVYAHMQFNGLGQRLNEAPYAGTASGGWASFYHTSSDSTNYLDARWVTTLEEVTDTLLENGSFPNVHYGYGDLVAPFFYPMSRWEDKQMYLYPCDAGCDFDGVYCNECAPGRKRSYADMSCIACEPGTYTRFNGSTACRTCVEHANCSNGMEPVAKPGLYRFTVVEIQEPETTTTTSTSSLWPMNTTALGGNLGDLGVCPGPQSLEPVYEYYQCANEEACLGSNECAEGYAGALCGQCETEHSYELWLPGRRLCRRCPVNYVRFVQYSVVFMVWGLTLYVFQMSALRASNDPSSGTCALMRILIRNIQMFGFVCEGMHLEEVEAFAIALAPMDVFFRPLSLLALDCEDYMTSRFDENDMTSVDEVSIRAVSYVSSKALSHIAIFIGMIVYFVVWHSLAVVLESCWRTICGAVVFISTMLKIRTKQMKALKQQVESISQRAMPNAQEDEAFDGEEGLNAPNPKELFRGAVKAAIRADAAADMYAGALIDTVTDGVGNAHEAPRYIKRGFKHSKRRFFEGASGMFKHTAVTWWKAISKRWSDFVRLCLGWMLLFGPPLLRGLMEPARCRQYDEDRLSYDYRVKCSKNEDLQNFQNFWMFVYAFITLFIVGCFVSVVAFARSETYNPLLRRMSCIMYHGYKDCNIFFEIRAFVKVSIMIFILNYTTNQVWKGALCLFGLLSDFMVVILSAPHEHRDRNICKFLSMAGLLGAAITIIGQLALISTSHEALVRELDEDLIKVVRVGAYIIILVWNMGFILYGVTSLFLTELVLVVQVAYHSGCELGVKTHRFLNVGKFIWGLNEITLSRSNSQGADHLLVHTQRLTVTERRNLDMTLRTLLEVCTSTGYKFYPSLLAVALNEAFVRAFEAREARMRARFQKHGSGTQAVLRCWPVNFGTLFQPLPDLARPGFEEGITVEELGHACESVRVDIVEYNPALRLKLVDAARGDCKHHSMFNPKTWEAATSVQGLLQDMLYSGTLNEQGGPLQGQQLRGLCRDYAHHFEAVEEKMTKEKMMKGRWLCHSNDLPKVHPGMAPDKYRKCKWNGDRRFPHTDADYEALTVYRCSTCGLELCGYCRSVLTAEKKTHQKFLNRLEEETENDEDTRIQSLPREKLLMEIGEMQAKIAFLEEQLGHEEPAHNAVEDGAVEDKS